MVQWKIANVGVCFRVRNEIPRMNDFLKKNNEKDLEREETLGLGR